jgi:phosphatidylinositol alpha-1,6-mannosyltransferase
LKKRILLVASEFPPGPGGIGYHAFCLAKELTHFASLTVLCNGDYTNKNEISIFDQNQHFKIVRFPRIGLLTALLRVLIVLREIRKVKPDSVIYTGLFSLWLINFTKLKTNRKTNHISIIHGHEPIFGGKLKKAVTKFSLQKFDNHVAVSRFAKSNLVKTLKEESNFDHIHVVPNGIDLSELSKWSSLSKSQNDLLVPMLEGFPKLLTVGHTSRRKGQHNVIRAMPEILKLYPKCYYYIVGRDVNNDGLFQLAKKLGVSQRVCFIPPIKNHYDLSYYYEKADIFMLLSENQENGDVEGFGIVALEANYFGCPVIGAKGCGVEDAVQNNENGFLVEIKSIGEITSRINEILSRKEEFSIKSANWALSLNWNRIINKYEDIINQK